MKLRELLQDMSNQDKISDKNKRRFFYNSKDVCYTLAIDKVLTEILVNEEPSLQQFYVFQQNQVCKHITTLMNRGVSVDNELKETLKKEYTALQQHARELLQWLVHDNEFNPDSPAQVKVLFKELCDIKPVIDKKTKAETFGAKAMIVYLEEYPQWKTLLHLYLEYKRIGVFVRTFLSAKLSEDGKIRCSYNVAGTKTYRLASKKNIDGGGWNAQNLPSGTRGGFKLTQCLQGRNAEEVEDSLEDLVEDGLVEEEFKSSIDLQANFGRVKDILIPDSDEWIIGDVDYSAIDLHFVVWEADCKYLKDIMKSGGDVYSVLAEQYYGYSITKESEERQVFKAVCHACVTGDHEVLTKDGWINVESLTIENEIAVWDKDTQAIWFEKPSYVNRDFVNSTEDLYHIEGAAFSFLGTQDHKFPATTDIRANIKKYEASKLPKSARIPYNGFYKGGEIQASSAYMKLIAALQADGHIQHIAKDGTITYRFKFVKERKINRLRDILTELGVTYKEYTQRDSSATVDNLRTLFEFRGVLLPEMKKLGWWILSYDKDSLTTWLEELQHWDGHIRKSNGVRTSISTTDREAAYIMQTVAHLCGRASKVLVKETDSTRKTLYEVSINDRGFHNMITTYSRGLVKHEGTKVYCPQTSTGYFVYRYKGNIAVSSNTNYLGMPTTIAAAAGLSVPAVKRVQDFYFSKCPEIKQWHLKLEAQANKLGYITNFFGARSWVVDKSDPMWKNKMVAWQPQSSAGILVNKAICRMEEGEKGINIRTIMQVHDSAVILFRKGDKTAIKRILDYFTIKLDYPNDPLTIPADIKCSYKSYGECNKGVAKELLAIANGV